MALEKKNKLDELLNESDETIFNNLEKRNAFLNKLFNQEEVNNINQLHLCLFQDQIKNKNNLIRSFDETKLNNLLTNKCSKADEDSPHFYNPHWHGLVYRSFDKKMFCRTPYNCAVVLEETDSKIVLGWLKYGTEVFVKNDSFKYQFETNEYNLDSYLIENGLDNILKFVAVSSYNGGLGNQLFAYWSGIVYALKNNKIPYRLNEIYIDTIFDLSVKPSQITPMDGYQNTPEFVKRYIEKIYTRCVASHYLSSESKCNLVSGYLQSWKNLSGYEDYIREHTVFKNNPSEKSLETMQKMKSENAVAVHVRRGDYVPQGYILLTPDYYEKAVGYIKQNVKNPVFYIFSNDQKWAKENIKIDAPHIYVDWTRRDYEDLELMSKCKHFINANSSFSWWGSFLSKNKNKIVIMPDKHASFNIDWIKSNISPNMITIEVAKHYWSGKKNQFVTEE